MALLDNCFFCSLSVAASVIGVYTLVAYVIAFLMETWWIATAPVSLPSPAYVLCAGYLIVSVFSGVLLRGLSIKNTLFMLEWLLVVAALAVPEGVLVYFMSIHYWNIRSLYGLMELTCWVCRAIVNISGIVCVQSLYSTWREEKEVLRRLRDLNMTRIVPPSRRNSVVSGHGHVKSSPLPSPVPVQLLNNGTFAPTNTATLQRTASMMSVVGRQQGPAVIMSLPPFPSEFNASQFDQSLSIQNLGPQINKSFSLMDLRSSKSDSMSDIPRKTMSVVDFAVKTPERQIQTQSLDRRILRSPGYWRSPSPHSEDFYRCGRVNSAYYSPFGNGEFGIDHAMQVLRNGQLIYGRNINTFYPGKPDSRSKQSVGSDSDDYKKYRDIAL